MEEGRNVVLSCRAGGHPAPQVRWKREDGKKIRKSDGELDYGTCLCDDRPDDGD